MLITVCLASNFSAIFAAGIVSSILLANFTEIAFIVIFGNIFLKNARTNVESTPPLNAIEIESVVFGILLLIFLIIIFSIFSKEGIS